jgi:hypothetical protein
MIKTIFTFTIIFILFNSCYKEKKTPPDEYIGKWEWKYSIYTFVEYRSHTTYEDIYCLNPDNTKFEAHFELDQKGKMKFYKNNSLFYKCNYNESINFYKSVNQNDSVVFQFTNFPLATHYSQKKPMKNKQEFTLKSYSLSSLSNSHIIIQNYFEKK